MLYSNHPMEHSCSPSKVSSLGRFQIGTQLNLRVPFHGVKDNETIRIPAFDGFVSYRIFFTRAIAQEVLPFPPTPSASIAGRTMRESTMNRRRDSSRLKSPHNILIMMLDGAEFAQADTYGSRIREAAIRPDRTDYLTGNVRIAAW